MTECSNIHMRDMLPDLVAARLAAADWVAVEAHVESCAECTEEVALLRLARSVRPRAVPVDVTRIVAALPMREVGAVGVAGPRLVRESPVMAPRTTRVLSSTWRMAAAISVAVIGGWSALTFRSGSATGTADTSVGAVATTVVGASSEARVRSGGETLAVSSTSGMATRAADSNDAASLDQGSSDASLGNLSEYSDEDLQRMLDRLEKWDGATSADPLSTVPIVTVTPRGTL
ncbi:MAG TPA: hypothetical protein VE869_06230 [Gemmatimonas sp.]|nr:hypothetical protein [Gemmatimonas sp.]